MEEDECTVMLDHLQQYVPHLEKLITQLKDPKRKNRELQLSKLEGLHSMITDRRKKLKLDTLKKCEDVILKILQKVKPNLPKNLQQRTTNSEQRGSTNLVKFVCKDPPESGTGMASICTDNDDLEAIKLKIARAHLQEYSTPSSPSPTRDLPRNHSPILIPAEKVNSNDSFEKPDIYRLAAESLVCNKRNSVERLSPKIDMSKPPLSAEDLLLLTEPERETYFEETSNLSMFELENIRATIKQKLVDTEESQSEDSNLESLKEKSSDVAKTKADNANKSNSEENKVAKNKLSLKPNSSQAQLITKPKTNPRIETVLKDPNSKFGDLLSSIDETILKDSIKKKDRTTVDDPRRKSNDKKFDKDKSESDVKEDKNIELSKLEQAVKHSEMNNPISPPPVYKRLADKYNPKPRKTSTEFVERTQLLDVRNTGEIRSPVESSVASKWFDKDPNLELPSGNSNLMLSLPSSQKSIPSLLGNQYIPNPNTMIANKTPSYPTSNFTSSQRNQYMQSQQQKHYAASQQNHFALSNHNQYGGLSQNMMMSSQNMMVPSQNMMLSPQNMMTPSQNIPPSPNITQHNSGGNTYMNTYIVQNNLSSNVAHGHFQNPQNTFHNQMISNKSFHPFQTIENGETLNNDYFSSQNRQALLPAPNHPGYQQNSFPHPNRPNSDPRKAALNRDLRERPIENNYKHDIRPKEITANTRAVQNVARDPRMRNNKLTPKENVRRSIEAPQNKYDTLYSNIDKESEQFISPLDRLYSGGEVSHQTGKGYGFQKFRIPKKNDNQQPKLNEPELFKTDDQCQYKNDEDNNVNDEGESVQDESDNEVIIKEKVKSLSPPPVLNQSKNASSKPQVLNASKNSSKLPGPTAVLQHKEQKRRTRRRRRNKQKSTTKQIETKKVESTNRIKKNKRNKAKIKNKETKIKQVADKLSSDSALLENNLENTEILEETATKLTSLASCESPIPLLPTITAKESNSDDKEITVVSEVKSEDAKATPNDETIIANYLAGLFQKANKEELLSVILSSLAGGTVEQQRKKFKRIQKIVESDSEADADVGLAESKIKNDFELSKPEFAQLNTDNESLKSDAELIKSDAELLKSDDKLLKIDTESLKTDLMKTETIHAETELPGTDTESIKSESLENTEVSNKVNIDSTTLLETPKKKKAIKRRSILSLKKQANLDEKSTALNSASLIESEQVVESVGERIKNRKRNPSTAQSRKGRKCRTELDMLHEDIKEMFICDGVLTATGKRMCRLLKSDEPQPNKNTRSKSTEGDLTSTLLDTPKRRARSSNPKVIIEKADLTQLAPASIKTNTSDVTKTGCQDASNSNIEKSDTESDISYNSTKRVLRHHRKLIDISSSTSESSLSSPVRKFPKRKIINKPNYYEDPNDLSVPKRHELKEKDIDLADSPVTNASSTTKELAPDLDASVELPSISTPPTIRKRKGVLKKISGTKNISKAKVTLMKKNIKKKKPRWNFGIIKKKKRMCSLNTTNSTSDEQFDVDIPDIENKDANVTPLPPALPQSRSPSPPILSEAEKENDILLVVPDRNYYYDLQEKPACKICTFKGKSIVHHYKSVHPKYEVLISRIAPDEVKQAIKESVDNSYEEIEISSSDEKARRRKFSYICRFCKSFFKNKTTETFFDHLTSHTGEYRFACTLCTFKTISNKCLRSHYQSSHVGKYQLGMIVPIYETPPSYHIVFGYVCSECYFIQLDEALIRYHMQIYHLGDNEGIFKISMSTIVAKRPAETMVTEQAIEEDKNKVITEDTELAFPKQKQDETSKVDKIIDWSTATAEPNKKSEPSAPYKTNKVLGTKKNVKKIPALKNNVSAKTKPKKILSKAKHVSSENVLPETAVSEFVESIEQNVNSIENLSAFQDSGEFDNNLVMPRKVVEDIPILIPKRHSFKLLDKLKNRLEKNDCEDSTDGENNTEHVPEIAQGVNKMEIVQETFSVTDDFNKPSYSYKIAVSDTSKYVLPKKTNLIQKENILTKMHTPINKLNEDLQGKLKSDKTQKRSGKTLIIPKIEAVVLEVGPVTATKQDNYILYSCNVYSCAFSTTIAHEFSVHCINLHGSYQWNRFCNVCNAVLEHCGFEAVDAYNHLVNVHLNNDVITVKQEKCAKQLLINNADDSSLIVENPDSDLPFKIVSVGTEEEQLVKPTESYDFPFILTDVRTLSADESETSDLITTKFDVNKVGTLAVITTTSTVTQPHNLLVYSQSTSACKSPPALQPFTKTTLPALVPVSKTSLATSKAQDLQNKPQSASLQKNTKRILLRDVPLQVEEWEKDRKSSAALKAFLTETKLAHLYKCPEFNCTFSTDSKHAFDAHLKQHTDISRNTQIPCLYCNYKTEFCFIAIHYDVRHSKCTHCCVYCLYRAVNQPYVEMHQDLVHHGMPRQVLVVPLNQDALLSQANITVLPLRDVVPPFLCSCGKKFAFGNDIVHHAIEKHSGILTCGYCLVKLPHLESVLVHMQTHVVYHYHCRYCLFGSINTDDVYKHLSRLHFAHPPKIVNRPFDGRLLHHKANTTSDSYYNDELLEALKIITHDYFAYFTPSARKEITPQPSANKTLISGDTKILSKIALQSDAVTNSSSHATSLDSPSFMDKLFKLEAAPMEILPLSGSNISSNTNSFLPKLNVGLTIPTSATKTIMTTRTEPNLAVTKEDSYETVNDLEKETAKLESINITPPESDTSVENSLSEVMDLTLSDSGEISISDLTSEESSFRLNKKIGLSGRDLYKCGFCKAGFELPRDIRSHVVKCVEINNSSSLKPYKCAHCVKTFKNVNNLLEHLRLHGKDRYACSLCGFKAPHQLYVRQHMKTKHKVANVSIMPVDRQKQDHDCDEFIMRPKSNRQKNSEVTTKDSNVNNTEEKSIEKLMYDPEEYESLPFRPIFSQELGCSVCGFTTKVKANLSRHLRLHLDNAAVPVPTSAPINPVPCLEKNEKMFDKMTNLSHSGYNSNSSRMSNKSDKKDQPINDLTKEEQKHIPLFVPATKRNVCGATGCDYLCLDDSMFKCHLAALHGSELFYKCKHCDVVLSSGEGLINVDFIIKHQKLHDLNLYKCKFCSYLYNVKHKVEHHITEAHPDQAVNVVVIREMPREPIDTSSYEREREPEEIKETKPWHCGMCKYRSAFKTEVATHVTNKHELGDEQYKCALCTFKSNTMNPFSVHFETEHHGQTVDVIEVYYKVEDKTSTETLAFDTTPIWKLNRNSNYIRGIPIEGSKSPKKLLVKSSTTDNLDRSIESVATGVIWKSIDEPKLEDDTPTEVKLPKVKERRKSISIAKKLELLKQKVNSQSPEIIEIEDDVAFENVKTIDAVEKPIVSAKETPIVEQEKVSFATKNEIGPIVINTLEEIEAMDLATLTKAILHGKYGSFGKPLGLKYLCPRCETFKTSVVSDITNHIYKELGYYKHICTICRLYGVTYEFLRNHSKNKHPLRPESIIPISPDKEIEEYVQMLIAVQNRIINARKTPNTNSTAFVKPNIITSASTIEEASSTTSIENEKPDKPKTQIHLCPHCDYTSKHLCDIRKHEKRHWLQKPLKCGYCDFEGVTNHDITAHSKRNHPNNEPSIVSMPMPSSPTIQPIVRKRKRPATITKVASDSSFASNDSFHSDDASLSVEVEDKPIHVCNYCRKRSYTQEEMEEHCQILHPTKEPRFKKILSSQLPKKNGINYKCFHCDFIATLETMKNHFKMDHPTLALSLYRYQCSYCFEYFRKLEKIKAHCKQLHCDDNPEHLDIINSGSNTTKEVTCEYCNFKCQEQELLDHHKNMHSHLELDTLSKGSETPETEAVVSHEQRYKCPECFHLSDKYPYIIEHLRSHAKPIQCWYCNATFSYPAHVKIHSAKEHPHLPIKHVTIDSALKKLEVLKYDLLMYKNGEYIPMGALKPQKRVRKSPTMLESKRPKTETVVKPTARKSTTQLPVIKETARKSTTQYIPIIELDDDDDEGFSYYGNQTDGEDIDEVKTSISLSDNTF